MKLPAQMPVTLLERVLSLAAPLGCLLCGKAVGAGELFCPLCQGVLKKPVTRLLNISGGRKLPVASPHYYKGGYRKTVLEYKFQGISAYAKPIGWFMAGAARTLPGSFDLVTYVPMARRARWIRGYNQSQLLARTVGMALNLPVVPALKKLRKTKTQHELNAEERAGNVRGAYGVRKGAPPLAGKAVLLVDDIVTTGNTLADCARALYEAGAAQVCALCAADADRPEKNMDRGEKRWIRKKSSGQSGTSWRLWERTPTGKGWRRPRKG